VLYWEDESIKDPVEKLKSRKTAVRDIAQFVRFNDLHELATVEVAENLLLEVPHHFVDYMVFR
jgi:hypothetical protein